MNVPHGVVGEEQRTLASHLQADGFTILQERYDPKVFGNYLLDLTTKDLTIRLVRDRDAWSIELSLPGWKEWIPVSMWRWIYEGGTLPGSRSDFALDADWVVGSLHQILSDVRRDPDGIHEQLRECGRARMKEMIQRARPSELD